MKWEYEFATGVFMNIGDLHDRLNALGRAGWEAVGVTQATESREEITILLKRKYRPRRELIGAQSTASGTGIETANTLG